MTKRMFAAALTAFALLLPSCAADAPPDGTDGHMHFTADELAAFPAYESDCDELSGLSLILPKTSFPQSIERISYGVANDSGVELVRSPCRPMLQVRCGGVWRSITYTGGYTQTVGVSVSSGGGVGLYPQKYDIYKSHGKLLPPGEYRLILEDFYEREKYETGDPSLKFYAAYAYFTIE